MPEAYFLYTYAVLAAVFTMMSVTFLVSLLHSGGTFKIFATVACFFMVARYTTLSVSVGSFHLLAFNDGRAVAGVLAAPAAAFGTLSVVLYLVNLRKREKRNGQ